MERVQILVEKGEWNMGLLNELSLIEMTQVIKQRKRSFIVAALLVGTTTATIRNVDAVYAVHDSKVYTQIVAQMKKATEQINQLKKQYDLHRQNMESLKAEHINPITSDVAYVTDEYNKLKKSVTGILSDTKSGAEGFKELFEDFKNLDYRKLHSTTIPSKVGQNREALEQTNNELIDLITKNQEALKKSNERIAKLTALIPETKGEKAIADLNTQIIAESVRAGNIGAEIQSLNTKQKVIKAQLEKLEKDAAAALNKKTGTDFTEAGEAMIKSGESAPKVKSQADTYRKLTESKGWF